MEKKLFLIKSEQEVNIIVSRILIWSLLIFPITIILSKPFIGLFADDYKIFLLPSIFATICNFLPYIFQKFNCNSTMIKYTAISASIISIGIVNSTGNMAISIILIYPIALSLLYFDRKLTVFTIVTNLINIFISQYICDQVVFQRHGRISLDTASFWQGHIWSVSIYLLEIIILSLIFIMLTKRTRNLLENLMDSEERKQLFNMLQDLTQQSAKASDALANSVNQLTGNTGRTLTANQMIADNASNAIQSSKKNLEYVEVTTATAQNVSQILDTIFTQAQEMSDISKETYNAAVESEGLINRVIYKMEEIGTSTMTSKELMHSFEERATQIGQVIGIIAGITEQTNLLSLNAAIESARAGEHGRGFSIVSQHIKELSEQSSKAATQISLLIEQEQADAKKAVQSIEAESETIKSGIQMVRTTGESFERLKEVQEGANQKAQEIASFATKSYEYGQKITEIINNIKLLTVESRNDIESIVSAIQNQLTSMNQVSLSVSDIDIIAEDLLNLSRSINKINFK